jgi:NTE family protein
MSKAGQCLLALISNADSSNRRNIELLKKYILVVENGWPNVNGCLPDKDYTVADFLLDSSGERVMLDMTRLTKERRKKFLNWFIKPHKDDCKHLLVQDYKVNEHRGYPAEVELNWWQRFKNSWFFKRVYHLVDFESISFDGSPQINSLEYYQTKNGILFGLNYLNIDGNTAEEDINREYQGLRNVKRVYITDHQVDKLLKTNIYERDYSKIIDSPHPYSINVDDMQQRLDEMREYRQSHLYQTESTPSLLIRIINFFSSLVTAFINRFRNTKADEKTNTAPQKPVADKADPYILFEHEGVKVRVFPGRQKLFLSEKRPNTDTAVLSGGGTGLYGHAGAYKAWFEKGLSPQHFVGSSAGAIMSTACYLGYTPDEIVDYYSEFTKENIVYQQLDSRGYSDTQGLRQAIDTMVFRKFKAIVNDNLDKLVKCEQGRDLLSEYERNKGRITFGMLVKLKKLCPDCSLKESLTITVTNATKAKTVVFSTKNEKDYDTELASIVAMSASIPGLYKYTEVNGERYMDGGVWKNFPGGLRDPINDTFLINRNGTNFGELGFNFNRGPERSMMDQMKEFGRGFGIIMWLVMRFLTGIKEPLNGWHEDSATLRNYSNQLVLIEASEFNAYDFNVSEKDKKAMYDNGYNATKDYLEQHNYSKENGYDEYLYEQFSLEELLYYCDYRGKYDFLDAFVKKIEQSNEFPYKEKKRFLEKAQLLLARRFNSESEVKVNRPPSKQRQGFSKLFSVGPAVTPVVSSIARMIGDIGSLLSLVPDDSLFEQFDPIFKLNWKNILDKKDGFRGVIAYSKANINRVNMTDFIESTIKKINQLQDMHIFGYFVKRLLTLSQNDSPKLFDVFMKKFNEFMQNPKLLDNISDKEFYRCNWNFSDEICIHLMNLLINEDFENFNYFLSNEKQSLAANKHSVQINLESSSFDMSTATVKL